MRFRSVILWNGVSQFGQSGVTLLSTIILAHILTPDDFAIIGIVTIFIAFSQLAVDSELGGALLRKKVVTNIDYSTLFYYNLVASIVLYGVMYFVAPYIAKFYALPELTDIIRVISLTIIIHAFRVVQRIMFFRDLKFREYAFINIICGLISLAVAIWLAKKGYGYWALVWQQIVLALSNVILMEFYNRFIPSLAFSKDSFRYQFSFGFSLFGSDIIRTIANNISTNIIGKISSLEFTGFYTQSSRITGFCQNTLSSLMDQSIFPMLAKYDKIEKIKATYHKLLLLISVGLLCATLIFVVFATPIVTLVLGKQWIAATGVFRILSLTILPASIQVLCRNILKTLGLTKKIFYIESIKSVLIIALLFIGALMSTYMVVWSLVVSQTLSCLIWLFSTNKNLNSSTVETDSLT